MSDDPTEHVQEHIHHEATHGHGGNHASQPRWITAAALTAAFLAALAAVSAALATRHLTESTLTRIAANDQWNYYQAKSIKRSIIDSREMAWELADENGRAKIARQHQDDVDKKAEYATKPEDEKDPEKPQGMKGI